MNEYGQLSQNRVKMSRIKMTIKFELLKVEKGPVWKSSCGETRNTKFGHHVNFIQRIQYDVITS